MSFQNYIGFTTCNNIEPFNPTQSPIITSTNSGIFNNSGQYNYINRAVGINSIVGYSSPTDTSSSVVDIPAHRPGNGLIAFFAQRGNNNVLSVSGWETAVETTGTGNMTIGIYYKIASNSEPLTQTFSSDTSKQTDIIICSIENFNKIDSSSVTADVSSNPVVIPDDSSYGKLIFIVFTKDGDSRSWDILNGGSSYITSYPIYLSNDDGNSIQLSSFYRNIPNSSLSYDVDQTNGGTSVAIAIIVK
jgi:hypothetical protein